MKEQRVVSKKNGVNSVNTLFFLKAFNLPSPFLTGCCL